MRQMELEVEPVLVVLVWAMLRNLRFIFHTIPFIS
jgi:hypothetical protein